MLYPLLKNVYSLCLVSTLAITTHPPRCCEDRARLVADKLANGKEPKDARRGCAIAIGGSTTSTTAGEERSNRKRGTRARGAEGRRGAKQRELNPFLTMPCILVGVARRGVPNEPPPAKGGF